MSSYERSKNRQLDICYGFAFCANLILAQRQPCGVSGALLIGKPKAHLGALSSTPFLPVSLVRASQTLMQPLWSDRDAFQRVFDWIRHLCRPLLRVANSLLLAGLYLRSGRLLALIIFCQPGGNSTFSHLFTFLCPMM